MIGCPRAAARVRHRQLRAARAHRFAGQIVSVYGDGLSAGQNQIVLLNRGLDDGMEPGFVLALWRDGRIVTDRTDSDRATLKLPDEREGRLFVFRVFKRMSYALILSRPQPGAPRRPVHATVDGVPRARRSVDTVIARDELESLAAPARGASDRPRDGAASAGAFRFAAGRGRGGPSALHALAGTAGAACRNPCPELAALVDASRQWLEQGGGGAS